jgi:hypothetical protein
MVRTKSTTSKSTHYPTDGSGATAPAPHVGQKPTPMRRLGPGLGVCKASRVVAAPVASTRRVTVSRRVRLGDVRPEMVLAKHRPEMVAQLATGMCQYVQFQNNNSLYCEEATRRDTMHLLVKYHRDVRPNRVISEQAGLEAYKRIVNTNMVPTAIYVSALPQMTFTGGILRQSGTTGSRCFTTFATKTTSLDAAIVASFEATACGASVPPRTVASVHTILPMAHYDHLAAADRARTATHDRGAMVAACLAPCLMEFGGHVNFLVNPVTAEWLLPLLRVVNVDANVPCKSKLTLLKRDMVAAVAVHGPDLGVSNLVKLISRDHGGPVYTVGDGVRISVSTVCVLDSPAPPADVLADFHGFLVSLLAMVRFPVAGSAPSFVTLLDTVLSALDLGTAADLLVEAPVKTVSPNVAPVQAAPSASEMDVVD